MVELRYPPILQGEFVAAARKLIDGCPPQQRQSVLDEIGAMHARGRVRSPLGLLKSLVDKAGTGQFSPSHSLSVYPGSLTQRSRDAGEQHLVVGAKSVPRSPVLASEIGREALSRLREKWRPDGG